MADCSYVEQDGRAPAKPPLPFFQGPIPSRDEIESDRPTFLPSKYNRPLLVWRGYAYRMRRWLYEDGFTWLCVNDRQGCKASIYTKRCYPCDADDVDVEQGLHGEHGCSATPQEVFLRRAKAEIMIRSKESQETLEEIFKEVLSNESCCVKVSIGNDAGNMRRSIALKARNDKSKDETNEDEESIFGNDEQSQLYTSASELDLTYPQLLSSTLIAEEQTYRASDDSDAEVPRFDDGHEYNGASDTDTETETTHLGRDVGVGGLPNFDASNIEEPTPSEHDSIGNSFSMTSPTQSSIASPQDSSIASPQDSSIAWTHDSSIASPQDSSVASPQDSSVASPQDSFVASPQDSSIASPAHSTPVKGEGITSTRIDLSTESYAETRSSSEPRQCPICSVVFLDEIVFRRHLYEELGIYAGKSICPECKVGCGSSTKMVDHFFIAHGHLNKYVCGVSEACVEAFWIWKDLLSHERDHH